MLRLRTLAVGSFLMSLLCWNPITAWAEDQDIARITYFNTNFGEIYLAMTGYTHLQGEAVDEKFLIPNLGSDFKTLAAVKKNGMVQIKFHRQADTLGLQGDINKVEVYFQPDQYDIVDSREGKIYLNREGKFNFAEMIFEVPYIADQHLTYWVKVQTDLGEEYTEKKQALMILDFECSSTIHFQPPINGGWIPPEPTTRLASGKSVCIDYDRERLYALGLNDFFYRGGWIKPSALGWIEFLALDGEVLAKYKFSASSKWQFKIPAMTYEVQTYFSGREYIGKSRWDSNFGSNFRFVIP